MSEYEWEVEVPKWIGHSDVSDASLVCISVHEGDAYDLASLKAAFEEAVVELARQAVPDGHGALKGRAAFLDITPQGYGRLLQRVAKHREERDAADS